MRSDSRWRKFWRSATREPLVGFLVLGGLIFAADAWLGQREPTANGVIVVSQARVDALRAEWQRREGQPPDAEAMEAMIDQWIESEVLNRQALALGLHHNDPLIRRQLERSMRYLLEDTQPLPDATRAELQAWLDRDPQRYGHPPTISFDHVFIARGADAEKRAADLLAQLRSGSVGPGDVGDVFPGPPHIASARPNQITARFGSDFGEQITTLGEQQWQGPLRTRLGWHLVRVTSKNAFRPAELATVEQRVRSDFLEHQRAEANRKAIDRLRKRFTIHYPAPHR